MASLAELNKKFALPDQVSFRATDSGMQVIDIDTDQASASIALQGAHLMTWAPRDAQPIIWLSKAAKLAPGKSIRGGVPICWPWFGPHDLKPELPGHGFARTVPWDLRDVQMLQSGAIQLLFRIEQSDATRAQWPHASEAEMLMSIGSTLEMTLITRNNDSKPFTIGDALHTYFEVGDVRETKVQGLDGCPYFDKVDGGQRKQQSGAVTIDQEVDRIYINSTADCVIEDPVLKRRIRIAKTGSASTVVWNPWIEKANKMGDLGDNGYLKMLCVESTNAASDVVSIPAGGEHRLWVRYSVEALA